MATTKRARSSTTKSTKKDASLAARTGRTIKERPYVSAAIATGAVTAVAAAAAGAFFFSRRDQSIGDSTEELKDRIKDGLSEAGEKLSSIKRRATGSKSQHDIAEDAMSLKESGSQADRPLDETVENQTKAGALAY